MHLNKNIYFNQNPISQKIPQKIPNQLLIEMSFVCEIANSACNNYLWLIAIFIFFWLFFCIAPFSVKFLKEF